MEKHYFAIFTRGVSYVKPSLDDVLDFVNDYAVIGLKHAFRRYGILSEWYTYANFGLTKCYKFHQELLVFVLQPVL